MDNEFVLAQELLQSLCGTALRRIDPTDKGILAFINESLYGIVLALPMEDPFLQLFYKMEPGTVYKVKSRFTAHFIVLRETTPDDYLILGPCLTGPFSDKLLQQWFRKNRIIGTSAEAILDYYQKIPVISDAMLERLGIILAQRIAGLSEPIVIHAIEDTGYSLPVASIQLEEQYDQLFPMRQLEHRYEASAALMEAVKLGNFSLAYQLYQMLFAELENLARGKNPLRSSQNKCIIMNSQLRSAVSKCGVHPFFLDRLSSQIAGKIEALTSVQQAGCLTEEMLREYCSLVQQNALPRTEPLIQETMLYIKTHLSEPLSVKTIAAALAVNADYLSHLFATQAGTTVTKFINRERVQQSATLLRQTNLPIHQIAIAVGYNNTSYFAKQFSAVKGLPPREYRKDQTAK